MSKREWLIFGILCLFVIILGIIGVNAKLSTKSNVQPIVVKLEVQGEYGYFWQGTGFFIEDDLIATAGHMVDGANEIWVIWSDGKRHKAVNWYQEDSSLTDAGFIYIRTLEKEPIIKFADAIVGETVRMIGNPFGYYPVLTEGIISAINIDEDFFGEKNLLLTDCPSNPGNSGSPLFNKDNEVLGILVGGIYASDGTGFAVPAHICELSLAKYKAIVALWEIE